MKIIVSIFFVFCLVFGDKKDPHNLYLVEWQKTNLTTNYFPYVTSAVLIKYWSFGKTNYDWWNSLDCTEGTNGINWFYTKIDVRTITSNFVGTNFKMIRFEDYYKEAKKK